MVSTPMPRIKVPPLDTRLAIVVATVSTVLLVPSLVLRLVRTVFYLLVFTITTTSVLLLLLIITASYKAAQNPPTPLPTLQASLRPLTLKSQSPPPPKPQPTDPLSTRLSSILGLIRISFILPWYSKISPSPTFPDAIDAIILHALSTATTFQADWPTVVTSRLLPTLTAHFEHFKSIQHLSSGGLPLPLPQTSHPALSARHVSPAGDLLAIERHLRNHVEKLVGVLLPEKERTEVVLVMVREIVLGAIVMPVFAMLSDPDFWNRQIVEQGEKYIHEKNQIDKVLSALSTLPDSPGPRKATATISINSTVKQFDDFMRSIAKLKTLGESRRLRADVDRELRAARSGKFTAIAGEDRDRALRRVQRYIHRLERARGQIDRRITLLSGVEPAQHVSPVASRVRANLYTIITNPACLAYWLEFMERRGRSHLVQFWLTVDGFKDPLEATGALGVKVEGPRIESTIGDDIQFLHSAYFATSEQKIVIPSRLLETINELAGLAEQGKLDREEVRRARRAVNDAQKAVYAQMEEDDWPAFQKSELYLKALAEMKLPPPTRMMSDRAVSYSPPVSPSSILSPLPLRSASDTSRRPYLVNGSFAPAAATPSTSTTIPDIVRRVSAETLPSSSRITPPPHRQSVHLDALFGAEEVSERNPLFADTAEDNEAILQAERMEAIQAALSEIIADDMPVQRKETSSVSLNDDVEVDPLSFSVPSLPERHPLEGSRLASRSADDLQAEKAKFEPPRRVSQYDVVRPRSRPRRGSADGSTPNLRTKSIFADFAEEDEDKPDDMESTSDDVQFALPGDLHLSGHIAQLDAKIASLTAQDALLSSLIRQAELTGNQKELRLLERSQSSLQRERRTAEFQVAQFRQQEEANRLDPKRTHIRIPTTTVSEDHQVVHYRVEISQVEQGRPVLSWTVAHRYSEFWDLDRALHDSQDAQVHAALRVELPGKRLVPSSSTSFVESRRAGLERYLQSLVSSSVLCGHPLVRDFLSRTPVTVRSVSTPLAPRLVKSLYKSVTSTYESGPSMLDLMSQSLSRQLTEVAGGVTELVPALKALHPPMSRRAPSPRSSTETDLAPLPMLDEGAGFTASICDLFIEVFDLKENWVRRQAIVIILQQILGGTIERKLRDSLRALAEPTRVEHLLHIFQDALWPGGERRPPSTPRTAAQMNETRMAASRRLASLIPDLVSNMMGKGNARRAANMLWGSIQDTRMNQHLLLCLIDEIIAALNLDTRI